jgi:diguanylate cyclase (GGDEF)-like protein/PAS domain S-box-containing protein
MSPFFEDPALYRSVLENLPIGIYVLDRGQRVRFWNRGAEQITGYLAHEVVGQICCESLPHCDPQGRVLAGDQCPITTTFCDGRAIQNHVFTLHKHGHRLGIVIRTLPFIDDNGLIVGVAVAFEERSTSAIADDSDAPIYGCLDPLTGVPSQHLTRAMLTESLATSERTQRGFGLLHITVLGLNELCARYGTDSIAAFLRTSAQTIRHNLDAKDFLGRWEEDEFLAILHSFSPAKIAATAELISRQISESEITWWGDRFRVRAEIHYVIAGPSDKPESLLARMKHARVAASATASSDTGGTDSTRPRG